MDMITGEAAREAGGRFGAPPAPLSPIAPLIVGSALLMQGIDGTAITVALPAMAQALGTDVLRMNLAVSAYLLSIAVFIPASGWIGERFGARTSFCWAIGLFILASLFCGLATSLPQLIAARVMQGIGGAMMAPVGRLMMLRAVPRHDYVRAISLYTAPALMGPVLGAPLGGLIVQLSSWHWIFFINIPLGFIGIAATLHHVPDLRSPHPGPFDLPGFLLLGMGLCCGTLALTGIAGSMEWQAIALLTLIGLIALPLAVLHARRARHPLLDLKLLRVHSFRVVMQYGTLWRVTVAGIPILLALLLQVGLGLGPLASGLILFTSGAGALAMKAVAGTILHRFGFRRVMIANAVIAALFGLSYALFDAGSPLWLLIPALFLGGVSRSLQYTGLGTLAFADLPDPAMGRASALASMSQELAQSLGVSIAALLIQLAMVARHGSEVAAADIRLALALMGALGLIASLGFCALNEEDGDAIRLRPDRR
ncbi:MFS transporter [Sphingobium lactosutens]|uniref:MFS transporter n=1 Tax=Sphingobium lactosutens TaxID=522773 RepID=UPI0015BD671C|nr:MFS transporter [Sphingobium lactosutens]NWK96303.1 MFS transporter [Sphingobium lactosutens]